MASNRLKINSASSQAIPDFCAAVRLARDKSEPAIVGNNSIDSIAAPIIAAATSGVIDLALTPVWAITTMMVSDGTAEENAKGNRCAASTLRR